MNTVTPSTGTLKHARLDTTFQPDGVAKWACSCGATGQAIPGAPQSNGIIHPSKRASAIAEKQFQGHI